MTTTTTRAAASLGREPTPEQAEIFSGFASRASFQVRAGAGCGKTTTAVAGLAEARESHALCVAFNKSIATELADRIPSRYTAATMNSVGHRAWMRGCSARVSLSTRKQWDIHYALLREGGESLRWIQDLDAGGDLIRMVGLARSYGLVPPGVKSRQPPLAEWEELASLAEDYDIDLSRDHVDYLAQHLRESIRLGLAGTIDFDDQLYLSTLWSAPFDPFPLVLVDEAQDLNNIQVAMLKRLVGPGGRLCAIGDPRQAIYGFRGANSASMDVLARAFDTTTRYPLLTTFRCPKRVVAEAQRLVPEYRAAAGNPDGLVQTLGRWSISDLNPRSAILCRVNAPLFSVAMQCLRGRIPFTILGQDICAGLVKSLRKGQRGPDVPVDEALHVYEAHLHKLAQDKPHMAGIYQDRLESVTAIIEGDDTSAPLRTLNDLTTTIERMFDTKNGGITLSSVHRAKGREWPDVYILDSWRMPSKFAKTPEAQEQERNIQYVAITRAQQRLFYVNKENME